MPDPNDEILQYLPSRAPEQGEDGYSSKKAEALCRRLVAVHCLYGVDKNPLAVELAKLSLWLESQSEGLPLTFLDHRLIVGDSLTGPFWEKLLYYPGKGTVVEDLFAKDAGIALTDALKGALNHVKRLDTSIGISLAEISEKEAARTELERSLAPFKVLAAAWSGGVMLGEGRCDDLAYARLLKHIGETGSLPEALESESLRAMVACGLGVDEIPTARDEIVSLLATGDSIPALSYDLTFPEVFYPTGVPFGRRGFDAVLGNPPWDRMLPADKEFFAGYNFEIMSAPTKRERSSIENKLMSQPEIKAAYGMYLEQFRRAERAVEILYQWQVVKVNGKNTIGKQDVYRLFMERGCQLLSTSGFTGVVVPSAFHANEGATGLRQLYLEHMGLKCCYSFENKKKLFEIHSSFKFATVVAQKGKVTDSFLCAFYLHDDGWLFGDHSDREPLEYTLEFVKKTGGPYFSLHEIRSLAEHTIADQLFSNRGSFDDLCTGYGISVGREVNLTDDVELIRLVSASKYSTPQKWASIVSFNSSKWLPVLRNRNFWQFTDWTGESLDTEFDSDGLATYSLKGFLPLREAVCFFRFAWRKLAASTNERTSIFALLPYGCVADSNTYTNRTPNTTSNSRQLTLIAIANSYAFDYCARLMVAMAVDVFIVRRLPTPDTSKIASIVSRLSLRLTCNHEGYEALWREQVGDEWRERGEPFTWPVLESENDRWDVRAAIDAVVADAYGLSREQYEHVLSTFSHKSYPKAPAMCMEKFDELKQIGLEEFARKYDPYWDIPLVETLPKPVIDLPIPTGDKDKDGQGRLEM